MRKNTFVVETKFGKLMGSVSGNTLRVYTPYVKGDLVPLVLRNIPHNVDVDLFYENSEWRYDWSNSRVRRVDTKYGFPEPTTDKCRSQIQEEILSKVKEIDPEIILIGQIHQKQWEIIHNHGKILELEKEIKELHSNSIDLIDEVKQLKLKCKLKLED